MKARSGGLGPRVPILFVKERDQNSEETDVALQVIRLPHLELEIGSAIAIEGAQRPRAGRRKEGERDRGEHDEAARDPPSASDRVALISRL
jgi:hypothetical protein